METAFYLGTPTNHGNTCANALIDKAFHHIEPAMCSHENLISLPHKMPVWEHQRAIMGTHQADMGTILGTHFHGFTRNMQASYGTKIPHLRWIEGGFAERLGLCRKAIYFPMQNLTNRRKDAPLLGVGFSISHHGHTFGHTFMDCPPHFLHPSTPNWDK